MCFSLVCVLEHACTPLINCSAAVCVYWHHNDRRWITIRPVTTTWLFLPPLLIILHRFLSLLSYSVVLFYTSSICHLSSPDNTRSSLNGWRRWLGQEIVFNSFSFFVFVRLSLPSLSLPHKLFLLHIYYMSASAPLSCFLVLCPLFVQNCMWILFLCTFYWLLMLFRVIPLLLKVLCTASL